MKNNNKNIKEWLNGRKCKVGKYSINFKQTSLEHDGKVIKLEPLTMELLCYLVNCHGRYIGQKELLDNVWEGRIVSDNAIRRVIKKLRDALGDDVKAPEYIKTVPSKGYLLIAPVVYSSLSEQECLDKRSTHINDDEDATLKQVSKSDAITIAQSELPEHTLPSQKKTKLRSKVLLTVVVAVFLSAIYWFAPSNSINTASDSTFVMESFINTPGETLFTDFNEIEKISAFANKKTPESHYQIYLKSSDSEVIQKITQGPHNYLAPKWSNDGKQLAYIKQVGAGSEVIVMSFDEKMNVIKSKSVFQYDSVQANVLWGPNDNKIYYSHQLSERAPFSLYSFDLKSNETKQVTFPENNTWGDYHARFSNNGNLLAVLRYIGSGKVELLLLDLNNGKVQSSLYLDSTPYSLVWDHNDQHVLLTYEGMAYRYNVKRQLLQQAKLGDNNIISFADSCNKNCILALLKKPNTLSILEVQNPFNPPNEAVSTFEFTSNSRNKGHPIYANDPSKVHFRTEIEGINQIVEVSTSGETTALTNFSKSENIYDLTYSHTANAITGLKDGRVFILNLATLQMEYVTTQMENSSRPNWSADGKSLYYTRDELSKPVIIKFNRDSKKKESIFTDAIEAKESENGESLYILNKNSLLMGYNIIDLNTPIFEHIVPTLTYISWHIFKDSLYYTFSDGQYHLAKVEIATQTFNKKPLLANASYARFNIHPSGTKILLKKETEANGEIIKLPLNMMRWHKFEPDK